MSEDKAVKLEEKDRVACECGGKLFTKNAGGDFTCIKCYKIWAPTKPQESK